MIPEARHFYAFSTRPDNPIPFYERTFGTEEAADRWVEASPEDRFITIGMTPREFYY